MRVDYKNSSGKYQHSKRINGVKVPTHLGTLWNNLKSRLNPLGAHRKQRPSYAGCRSDFTDFQDFSHWCVNQIGYGVEGFQLDKDIIGCGKLYSKDTIVFVPTEINVMFEYKPLGIQPKGVVEYCKGYRARCRDGAGGRDLSRLFSTPQEAADEYNCMRNAVLNKLAEKWKDKIDVRVYIILTGEKQMSTKELQAQLEELVIAANAALNKATVFADEHKLSFTFEPAYGMGGQYVGDAVGYDYMDSGWNPSSVSC